MITLLIVLALVAAVVLWAIGIYNSLVRKRSMVEEAWSGIDVQLKRRTDLIPNLVSTVKGYAAHEKGTLEEVVRLRNLAQNAQGVGETAQAQGLLGAALGRLIALAENYPELRASDNFAQLQATLGEIETLAHTRSAADAVALQAKAFRRGYESLSSHLGDLAATARKELPRP